MYQQLGRLIERWWAVVLAAWFALLVVALGILTGGFNRSGLFSTHLPTWKSVAVDGEFAHLPHNMQSLEGERLLAKAFPDDAINSSIVVIVRRPRAPLTTDDEAFVETELVPRIMALKSEPEGAHVSKIRTPFDPLTGQLLASDDHQSLLIVIGLTREFLEWSNQPIVERVERLIYRDLAQDNVVPRGLELAMSGTATVGRDMLVANSEGAKKTELWTTILVVALLVGMYRAPILALIPLLTVFMSVQISLAMLAMLTQVPGLNFSVFMGMEVYITVVVYGAGVDYCLFLIARYKEELDSGVPVRRGVSTALGHVGAALAASAGTVICGIGMMAFAQFGKFREAGIGIALSLCVVLLASLTLTPALLRVAGTLAFWPYGRSSRAPRASGWLTGTSLIQQIFERNPLGAIWDAMGRALVKHPAKILTGCVAAMLPFAIIGVWMHDQLSYGLLSELRSTNESVKGSRAVQAHFPAGYAGPLTVLVRNDNCDFRTNEGAKLLKAWVDRVREREQELGIVDIRYLGEPVGRKGLQGSRSVQGARKLILETQKGKSREYYVTPVDDFEGHVTRLEIIFQADPFSQQSIRQLRAVEISLQSLLNEALPAGIRSSSQMLFVGATASLRDLKTVTDSDQIRIDLLVLTSVFLILVVLLRKPAICLYLIASVFFSYFVTLGVTVTVFWCLDPSGFAGLDWKVPMFLFTILIAVGEDYNIFLMTRIEEEQLRHGSVDGVRIALSRTGSIISSCGIIMAGTFLSLVIAGTLLGMQQLGFALAFGVLLDTFVVRPILVPAYLVLLYAGRFGALGRYLGQTAFDANLPQGENAM